MPKAYRFNDTIDQSCDTSYPDPVATIEPIELDPQAVMFTQMAELLTPIFLFLSRGAMHRIERGSAAASAHRAWIVLHCVRPDITKGESMQAYAKRWSISLSELHQLHGEFIAAMAAVNCGASRAPNRQAPNS